MSEEKLLDDHHPWTVMIRYLKVKQQTTPLFFVTEITADSPEEAIAIVLSLGYSLPKDAFELTARRVPVVESQQSEKPNGTKDKSVSPQKVSVSSGIRTQAGRK